MKARCSNPKAAGYENYGGRGITVCARWRNSFETFLADMGPRPPSLTPGSRKGAYSLGRIDNDGPYQPDNCRWETTYEQNNNTRGNARIVVRGSSFTVEEACAAYEIPRRTYYGRLKSGMTPEQALTAPNARGRRTDLLRRL